MTLADEVSEDFSKLLGEEGRGVVVAWGQKSFRALIGNPAVEFGLVAGGFDSTSGVMMKALRSEIGLPLPARGERLIADGKTYKVTGVADNSNWPVVTIHAEMIT
ncbi:MAG TPA: hypothetical protein PKY95_07650 [candidate division Zixibacteria bacterium]|nr:hypothetical protein [candidate division Zixibacteria bacterium]